MLSVALVEKCMLLSSQMASLNNPFLLPFSSAPTLAEEAILKQKCLLTTEL